MRFQPLPLEGAYLIDLEKMEDERGFFARLFCADAFSKQGLESTFIQANNSLSKEAYTLRGLHYQLFPKEETKLVRCVKGALWDVILDLRPGSKTFGRHFGETLTEDNRKMMYVPKGFAHGFMTLVPETEILYLVSENYSKERERGVRFDDTMFKIPWPKEPQVISERDKAHPDFSKEHHLS